MRHLIDQAGSASGVERRGPECVALRIRSRYRVPAELAADRATRSARRVALPLEIRLRLWSQVDRIDVEIDLDNRARDHRLRAVLCAPLRARRFEVESAFEVAARPIAEDMVAAARPIGMIGPHRAIRDMMN